MNDRVSATPQRLSEELGLTGPREAAMRGSLDIGRVYAGQYLVRGILGMGGMGEVYRVEHQTLRAELALKVLSPVYRSRPDIVARFHAESRALWELSHPSFVKVNHAGDDPQIGPHIVMELLSGKTLAQVLYRFTLPVERMLQILIEVADACETMHALGIIHRDLKPENIFVVMLSTPRREYIRSIKLLDLGAAKIAKYGQPETAENKSIGTGKYMSPEHIRASGLSARSDIYALGHIAYEMLAGHHAYGKDHPGLPTHLEYQMWHINATPLPLDQAAPHVDADVAAVVHQAIAKRPEDRFQSMGALANALRAVLTTHQQRKARGQTKQMKGLRPEVDDATLAAALSSSEPDARWGGGWGSFGIDSTEIARSKPEVIHGGTKTAEVGTTRDPISKGAAFPPSATVPRSTQRMPDASPTPARVARLVAKNGPNPGHAYVLARGTYVVGREANVDIHIPDPSLSGRHARIVVHPTGVVELHDEGSTNGTRVNDKVLPFAVIRHGDRITFGTVVLEVEYFDPGKLAFGTEGTVRVGDEHAVLLAGADISSIGQRPTMTSNGPLSAPQPPTQGSAQMRAPLAPTPPMGHVPTSASPLGHAAVAARFPAAASPAATIAENHSGVTGSSGVGPTAPAGVPSVRRKKRAWVVPLVLGSGVGLAVLAILYWWVSTHVTGHNDVPPAFITV